MLKSVLSVRSSQSENFAEENVYLVTGDKERKTLRCQLFWRVNAKAGYLNQVVWGNEKEKGKWAQCRALYYKQQELCFVSLHLLLRMSTGVSLTLYLESI